MSSFPEKVIPYNDFEQETFENEKMNREVKLEKIVHDLTVLLAQENPPLFNKQWILAKNPALHARAYKYVKRNGGWETIKNKLPQQWQPKWIDGISSEKQQELGENSRKYTLSSATAALNQHLTKSLQEGSLPEKITSQDIEKSDRSIFRYFERYHTLPSGGIDWETILPGLIAEGRKRFIKPSENTNRANISKYTLESAIAEINRSLSQKSRPRSVITSKTVERLAPQAFGFLANHYKNPNGKGVNWDLVLPHFFLSFQQRFKKPRKNLMPREFYRDPTEVDRVLEKVKDQMYVMLVTKNSVERKKANEIYSSLILLAQKGNEIASDLIANYSLFLANQWIDDGGKMAIFNYYPDLLKEKIRRCYFSFDTKKPQAYVFYLYISLCRYAEDLLKNTKLIELNKDKK